MRPRNLLRVLGVPLVLLILAQIVMVVFWMREVRDNGVPAARGYMARGEKSAWLDPERAAYHPGESATVHFAFVCRDTAHGDRVFASLLVHGDTAIRVASVDLSTSRAGITLIPTHVIDSGPLARGWTMAGLAPGDTVHLQVQLAIAHLAPRADWEFLYGMERDDGEPIELDRITRRRLVVD